MSHVLDQLADAVRAGNQAMVAELLESWTADPWPLIKLIFLILTESYAEREIR